MEKGEVVQEKSTLKVKFADLKISSYSLCKLELLLSNYVYGKFVYWNWSFLWINPCM